MSLTTRLAASISAQESNAEDQGTAAITHALAFSETFANGTGANQADRVFSDDRQLAASANEDLDLAGSLGGKLVGVGSGTVVFAELAAIIVVASPNNTNNVNITRPASNGVPLFIAAGDGITLGPGDVFFAAFHGATGKAITAGTGDLLNFANSAGGSTVNYKVILIGRSA